MLYKYPCPVDAHAAHDAQKYVLQCWQYVHHHDTAVPYQSYDAYNILDRLAVLGQYP